MTTASPLLFSLLLAFPAVAQEVRHPVTIDPGGVVRPARCPVTMQVPAAELPTAARERIDQGRWSALLTDGSSYLPAQVRVAHGEGGQPTGLELAWLDPGLASGRSIDRELVLHRVDLWDVVSPDFELVEVDGARELRQQGSTLWRHEVAWDPERYDQTFRPYTHLFGLHDDLLTKGPGGLYTHHRGIFLGWTRTKVGDTRHNFWSIPGKPRPHQQHVGWDEEIEWTGPLLARVAARTDWITAAGEVLVEERREWDTWRYDAAPGSKLVLLDYRVTLTVRGELPVELGGDPPHAGFQIRLAQSVAQGQACEYLFPKSATGGKNDNWSNAPWVAGRFPMGERRYELLFHDHPGNPAPSVFNTRKYGRFGPSFFTTVAPGEPLELRYALRLRELVEDHPHPEQLDADGEHAHWVTPVAARLAR